jgi:hypothetical protein
VERIAKPAEQAPALPVFSSLAWRLALVAKPHVERTLHRMEAAMYATIRRYKPTGTVDRKALEGLKQRIESGFLPQAQEIRGFHSYYVVNVGDKELVSIGVFEDKTGAAESTRRAAEFVKKDPLKDQIGSPEIIEGELLVSREAPVGA